VADDEGEDEEQDPQNYQDIRRRWRRHGARSLVRRDTAGRMVFTAPDWLGPAVAAVFIGGALVAVAGLVAGSGLVWVIAFAAISYWFVDHTGVPWWAGGLLAFPTLIVANHVLPWLVLHGGLGTFADALRFYSSVQGRWLSGRWAIGLPVLAGAGGGFVAHYVRWSR